MIIEKEKGSAKPKSKPNKPRTGKVPSPPDFLLRRQDPEEKSESLDLAKEAELKNLDFVEEAQREPAINAAQILAELGITVIDEALASNPPELVPSADLLAYNQAIEDRRKAEINYGELYVKHVELTAFSERLLKKLRGREKYQARVRAVYDRAKIGDKILNERLRFTQEDLRAAERAMNALQIENESLLMTAEAHEEGFKNAQKQIQELENKLALSLEQFQALSQEYENRGILLEESDRKIRSYLIQIDELNNVIRESQVAADKLRDGNLILQNQLREIQVREASLAALNSELTDAMRKAQKQMLEIEQKMKRERVAYQKQIHDLIEDIDRHSDIEQSHGLVKASERIQDAIKGINAEEEFSMRPPLPPIPTETDLGSVSASASASESEVVPAVVPVSVAEVAKGRAALSEKQREAWSAFYGRWSQIIDELSTQSTPIARMKSRETLVSESGEIEVQR